LKPADKKKTVGAGFGFAGGPGAPAVGGNRAPMDGHRWTREETPSVHSLRASEVNQFTKWGRRTRKVGKLQVRH